jgi:hypothetical protein
MDQSYEGRSRSRKMIKKRNKRWIRLQIEKEMSPFNLKETFVGS